MRFTPTRVGKTKQSDHDREPGRFTPTRVGKTLHPASYTASPSVHPHARGENHMVGLGSGTLSGSPPRAWGKLAPPCDRSHGRRFTPTRVGKTAHSTRWAPRAPVHPHARGENPARRRPRPHCQRFTPTRVGKTNALVTLLGGLRFTPTRVGKTCWCRPTGAKWTVHPHARGENSSQSW